MSFLNDIFDKPEPPPPPPPPKYWLWGTAAGLVVALGVFWVLKD